MKTGSRALRVGVALLLPCVTLIAAHVLVDPLYRTNDDPSMMLLAAGEVYVDEPTPYLVFSNHLWGLSVATLYDLAPGVPWYRLLQILVQILAGAGLVYPALGSRRSISDALTIGPPLLVFDLLWWSQPHFTLTAAAAAIAATFIAGRRIVTVDRPGRLVWGAYLAFWVLAALIRHQSALLVFGISLAAFAAPFLRLRREAGVAVALRRIVPPVAVAGGVIGLLFGYNHWRYDVPEWRDFIETGPTIGAVLDFGAAGAARSETWEQFPDGTIRLTDVDFSPATYAAAADGPGWTRSELRMLMAWFYADRETFSLEKVSSFLDEVGEPQRRRAPWLRHLRADPNFLLMLAVLVYAVASRRLDRFDVTGGLLALLAALGVLTFIDVEWNRLVSWVYEPVLALLVWIAVMLGRDRPLVLARRPGAAVRLVLLVAIATLLTGTATRLIRASEIAEATRRDLTEAVTELAPDPEHLYVSWASAFPVEYIGPLDDLEPYRNLRVYSVGADTRGGHNLARLETFGIDDIHAAMFRDSRLRTISQTRENKVFVGFVRERFGVEVEAELVERFDAERRPLFDVFRFVAVKEPE